MHQIHQISPYLFLLSPVPLPDPVLVAPKKKDRKNLVLLVQPSGESSGDQDHERQVTRTRR
jgi:hypothetical protein